jgi:hypothetical protein
MATGSPEPSRAAGIALAAALAQRLAPHLPDGLSAGADSGQVWVRGPDGSSGGIDIAWMLSANAGPWADLVEGVLERALNAVQDKVATETARPWPAEMAAAPAPWARVADGLIRLGYGEPAEPVLELDAISLPAAPD